MDSVRYKSIRTIHTLGPSGTNCEKAAAHIAEQYGLDCEIVLHETLESAVSSMQRNGTDALVACVVYPPLHEIVFKNLSWLELSDTVTVPTHEMVFAKRSVEDTVNSIASHSAPASLAPENIREHVLVDSNVIAAEFCAARRTDGCITTMPAVKAHGLVIVENHGPINMGFTFHTVRKE